MAPSSKFSRTVNSGITDLPSETCEIPRRTSASGLIPAIFSPFHIIDPLVGCLRPESVRSSVVLPAPFAPIMAASLPVGTAIETWLIAHIAPW